MNDPTAREDADFDALLAARDTIATETARRDRYEQVNPVFRSLARGFAVRYPHGFENTPAVDGYRAASESVLAYLDSRYVMNSFLDVMRRTLLAHGQFGSGPFGRWLDDFAEKAWIIYAEVTA